MRPRRDKRLDGRQLGKARLKGEKIVFLVKKWRLITWQGSA
ncbi:MAG: hypothetical protein ACRC6D_04215 [Aeromonas sp.]